MIDRKTFSSQRRRDLWDWLWTGFPAPLRMGEGDREAFRALRRETFSREVHWITAMITLFNVAFWFTDPWLMRHIPNAVEAFHAGRVVLMIVAGSVWILHSLFPRHVYVIGTSGGGLALFFIARLLGDLGTTSGSWFHFIYPFMLVVVAEWMTPLERVIITALYSIATLSGYIVGNPDWALDPLLGVSLGYFSFVALLSLLIGVYVDHSKVRFFHAQRELARAHDHLEARVEEKTAALHAFVAHLDHVQDQERSRWAQDLHDELGQVLTAQRLVLRLARRRHGEQCADIGPNLEQLEALTNEVLVQFRALLKAQRQRVLDELGIEAALRDLSRTCEEKLLLPCRLAIEPEPLGIGPVEAVTVYRCVQEALTNAAKHASATQVHLDVRLDRDELVASVEDDGVGIHLSPGHGGFGLLGARERVKALNGSLEVRARPTGGTLFQIRLPHRPGRPA